MNDEIIHKIERIEKMLELLLNEEQKEEIKQFDIEYLERMKKEAEWAVDSLRSLKVNMKELQAINKQVEELG